MRELKIIFLNWQGFSWPHPLGRCLWAITTTFSIIQERIDVCQSPRWSIRGSKRNTHINPSMNPILIASPDSIYYIKRFVACGGRCVESCLSVVGSCSWRDSSGDQEFQRRSAPGEEERRARSERVSSCSLTYFSALSILYYSSFFF